MEARRTDSYRFLVQCAVIGLASILAYPAVVPAQPATNPHATGTVTKVDSSGGRVTIAHEPIPAIQWPAMTMNFKVKDKALLNGVKPGQKVVFVLEKSGSDYVVADLK